MAKIIKQVEEANVSNIVSRIHDRDDIGEGDLIERLEEYKYYNHVEGYLIAAIDLNSFDVDQDKVDDIIFEIKEIGLLTMPKIVIDEKGNVIDGLHRLNALNQMGFTKIDLLRGTNTEHKAVFKKELIDEELKIYKISNDFGSISVMEEAKYSPSDNSVSEFIVAEKYRGLGVGTELLKEASRQYPNLGAQVSSVASIKAFLECGFEPFELDNKNKFDLDTTSIDFKLFNKVPELLNDQSAMYRRDIYLFKEKFENAKLMFESNDHSLFFEKKGVKPMLKNTYKTPSFK